MAFRRSNNFRRPVPRRRSFSRNRTHTVKKLGHWQRANFSLLFEMDLFEQNNPSLLVAVVTQIQNHLGDSSTAAGRLRVNEVRALEIGGIVFDWQITARGLPAVEPSGSSNLATLLSTLVLATDRLDSDGAPAALASEWFNSTTPIPVAASTEAKDEDIDYPTRVHWRTTRAQECGRTLPINSLGPEYAATPYAVVLANGSKNLRLRIALDDQQALVFHWASNAVALATAAIAGIRSTLYINGSLYYRVRD